MIEIQQLKLPITHDSRHLKEKVCRMLHIKEEQLLSLEILRQSIDARKKQEISYVYTVLAETEKEEKVYKKQNHKIEERRKDVSLFWETGVLHTESNVSFGEGGAGTFSDGKLNTLVKDKSGRNRKVLEIFMDHGAPKEIAYEAKPHIGTDKLSQVIPAIRKDIENMGGRFLFHTCMTDIRTENGKITGLCINHDTWLDAEILILAIGHSARDTFGMLFDRKI
ncbi:MAG: FAD-dependent oxidoreductase, partial [Lachnospiraceae bacterium]|nr:FAD-dependent oxidoreductase [Lachnospiraceae bacterium]